MAEAQNAIVASVGQRAKQERLARKMRLSDVSQASGISVPMLSKFENGRISLNFRHVVAIARALGVAPNQLLGTPKEAAPLAGRRSVTRNGQGYRQTAERLDYEMLCDDLAHRHNIFWKAQVKARSLAEAGELSGHPGEEFILVLKGAIVLHSAAYKPLRLDEGDSVHFDGSTPHAYVAASDETPLILLSNSVEEALAEGISGNGDGPDLPQ